jgi:hypothetical protein
MRENESKMRAKMIVIEETIQKKDDSEDNDSRWYNRVRTLEWWPSSSGATVPGSFVTACPAASSIDASVLNNNALVRSRTTLASSGGRLARACNDSAIASPTPSDPCAA